MRETFINTEDSIPIVIATDKTVNFFVKSYHAYKHLWKPLISEKLTTEMQPDNAIDKYAVCVNKTMSQQDIYLMVKTKDMLR